MSALCRYASNTHSRRAAHSAAPHFETPFGFEVGGGSFGKATYHYAGGGTTTVSTRTLEFLATGMLHVNPKLDVIAKVGGIRATPEVTGINATDDNTVIQPQAGIGIGYNLNERFAVTLNYTHVFGDSVASIPALGSTSPSLNEALLGIRYNFGS